MHQLSCHAHHPTTNHAPAPLRLTVIERLDASGCGLTAVPDEIENCAGTLTEVPAPLHLAARKGGTP